MRDKIFYLICFGFMLGVLVRSFIFVDFYFVLLGVLISVALFTVFTFISRNNFGVLIVVFALLFSLGIMRFHAVDVLAPDMFESQVGQQVSFNGVIVDEPT